MIIPTRGRIVMFTPACPFRGGWNHPFPAIITDVHNNRCVSLTCFGERPNDTARFGCWAEDNVRLRQPEDELDDQEAIARYCEWMAFQIKKTTGSESGERAAGVESIG